MDTQHIDLLGLIGRDTTLKRQGATNGGEFAGPCPFCGGHDRFRVWPNAAKPHYWCRQCQRRGDAIAYVRERDHVDFKAALKILKLDNQFNLQHSSQTSSRRPVMPPGAPKDLDQDSLALSDPAWQEAAQAFMAESLEALHSSAGRNAYTYLKARGLSDQVVGDARLGFNPQWQQQEWGQAKVYLQSGIVIPWSIHGSLWRVKIRSLDANPKFRYSQAAGGANGLYGGDQIPYKGIVLVTEGEFDALAARTQLQELPNFAAVATGSTKGARIFNWVIHLGLASTVLLAFDADTDGDDAAQWWQEQLGAKAMRLRPIRHDITDMAVVGDDLLAWIGSVCPLV